MPRIATPKAAPMSRKVTQVISHSPSHSTIGLLSSIGLAVQADVGPGQCPPQSCLHRLVDRQHAVDRRLVGAGQFALHHVDVAAVAPEDRGEPGSSVDADHVTQFDNRAVAGQGLAGTGMAASPSPQVRVDFGSAHGDLERIAALAAMGVADDARRQERRSVSNTSPCCSPKYSSVSWSMTMRRRGPCTAIAVVDIDDVGNANGRSPSPRSATARRVCGVRAVDLGQQRRHHRRPGRRLDHLDRPRRRAGSSPASRWRRSSAMAWLLR